MNFFSQTKKVAVTSTKKVLQYNNTLQSLVSIMSSLKGIVNPALRAAAHVRSSNLPKELSKSAAALLSSAPSGGKHVLPDLPYDYNALERKQMKKLKLH